MKKLGLLAIGASLISLALFPHSAKAALPADLRKMPVSINIPVTGRTDTGSGVYLLHSNWVYLVTAQHVLFDVNKPDVPLRGTNCVLVSIDGNSTSTQLSFATVSLDLKGLDQQGLIKS